MSSDATSVNRGSGRPAGKGIGALEAASPPEVDKRQSIAGGITGDRSFDPAKSTRIASAASETSDVYANPDGSFTRKVYERPVNFKASDGTWKPIDRTLVKGEGGRFRQKAGPTELTFAAAADDPELATLRLDDTRSVSYSLHGATMTTPTVSGTTLTYPGVLPHTDLRLATTPEGIKESLVLHSPEATNSWVFPLRLQGLTASLEKDGSVALRDGLGEVAARIPAGFMHDSHLELPSGEFSRSEAVTYELTMLDGMPALRVSADEKWLRDPKRVYPVTVDPTLGLDTSGDTYVQYGNDVDHSGEDNLAVGTWDGGVHRSRALLSFSDFGVTYSGKRMRSVSLNLYLTWQWNCTAQPFTVHPITEKWSNSTVRYGSSSYSGPGFGSSIGSASPNSSRACNNTGGDRSTGNWVAVPLSTATFQNWALGKSANYGLGLLASPTDSKQFKRFTSRNGPDPVFTPYLSVTYDDNVAPQVNSQYPLHGRAVATLTPELQATAHDPDGWPGPLTYDFLVYDKSGKEVARSGRVSARNWTVPAGKLNWGEAYSWTVIAHDGLRTSSSQKILSFTTPVPQPLITSGLSQNDKRGFEPSVGNYTTSATDATVATVGPPLSIHRSYNSQDPRRDSAFGEGWSSLLDMRITDPHAGVVSPPPTVNVRYPNGQEVTFGRNGDGSYAPPPGRFATLTQPASNEYKLVDKDGTTYRFQSGLTVAGEYAITSVSDAAGRTLTLTYGRPDGRAIGVPTRITSASGRSLHLTWSVAPANGYAHVQSVATDPATPGDPSTALTWRYFYDGDLVTQVCPPTSTTACTRYTYSTNSRYPSAVLNAGAKTYWRLGEESGTVAANSVLDQMGTDNATYANVTLGQPGPLPGSAATAASFNGTNSSVALPKSLLTTANYVSVSLWFKTTQAGGFLLSKGNKPLGSTTAPSHADSPLYVGTDGKLRAGWYTGASNQIASTQTVNDGRWHHAVLTGAGNTQTLYLDGAKVGTLSGVIDHLDMHTGYIGAGYSSGRWPAQPPVGWHYYNGLIADVAMFEYPLTPANVAAIHGTARAAAHPLASVIRPSGNPAVTVAYDPVDGTVTRVTDEHGGVWKISAPTVSGSGQVYAATVLAAAPSDYWRMAETDTTDAINEVNGSTATYDRVTLGVANGPFGDTTVAGFNGSNSSLHLEPGVVNASTTGAVGMWFKTTQTGGVLLSQQNQPLELTGSPPSHAGIPLYVGTDGKLHAAWYTGTYNQIVSSRAVNDGKWHHVVLNSAGNTQSLYLDGAKVGSLSGVIAHLDQEYGYVGAGYSSGKWAAQPPAGWRYFNGQLGELAFYRAPLTDAQVAAQWAARDKSVGLPVKTVSVTDPGDNTLTYSYDVATGRKVAETDALGNKTQYGYDVKGFLRTVTDPNGNVTTTEHDVRGNTVSSTTCQDRSNNKCSTIYYTYYPDATSTVLTPDPRNDVLLTERDARSASATDNTYLTSYSYDSRGNRTKVTDPLGRQTTTTYTDGSTVAAHDGGFAPAGLPASTTTPGGARETIVYYRSGDIATITDAVGKVTTYTYDGLGRVLTKTEKTNSHPAGLTTQYAYDGLNRVVSQTDPAVTNRVTGAVHTAVTTTAYNEDGLVTTVTVADATGGDASRTESATYNEYGQKETSTDADGNTTTFEYDVYGRVVREVNADGGEVVSTYDAEGQLLTSTLRGWTGDPNNPSPPRDLVLVSRAYDPAGRLASETDAMGWQTVYSYTDNGLTARISRKDPSTGATFVQEETGYDAAGNVVSRTTNNQATTTTYALDRAGRITGSTLDPSGLKRTTTYSLSPDNHILATTLRDSSGLVSAAEARYDALGRITAETIVNDSADRAAGWWRLDETSGTVAADASGAQQSGAVGSGVTWSDGAARFNGTTAGLIHTSGPVLNTAQSYSVSAWVNLADTASYRTVLAQGGTNRSAFYLQYSAVSRAWCLVAPSADATSPSSYASACAPTPPVTSTWVHLVGVFDTGASAMRLYVNGNLAGSASNPFPWNATGPLSIGGARTAGGTVSDSFNGFIDNVQVYQRALSAADVVDLHGRGRAGDALAVTRLTTTWSRDQRGLPLSMTDPNGNTTDYEHDEAGRLAVTVAPPVTTEIAGGAPVLSRPVSYVGYDTFGAPVETKDPNGNVTVTGYDAAGRATSVTLPSYTAPGTSTPVTPVTRHTYDRLGQLETSTDPLGKTTRYTYDQLGRVAKVVSPNGGQTKYTYDLVGDQLSVTDPTGARAEATYDFVGRQVSATDVVRQTGTSHTTTYAYGFGGWLASATSPEGVVTATTYNPAGEPVTVTDGANQVTRYEYDGAGRRTRTTLPDGTATTVSYDMAGRPIETRDYGTTGSLLRTQSSSYDNGGRLKSTTDARGTTNTFTYDALGRLTSQVQPISDTDSITTSFGYDPAGNRTRFTDGRGNAFLATYNPWDLPESRIEPATSRWTGVADRSFTTVYDAAGRVAVQRAPGGVSVTNSYDDAGNLVAQVGDGAEVATAQRSFDYDLAGRMTSVSGPGGSNTFTHDDRGLLLSTSGPSGTATFTWNADRRLTSRADAAGTTSYTYDSAGRAATVSNPGAGTAVSFTYNAVSQVKTVAYGAGGNTRWFSYDGLHRLTGDELKTASGASVAKINYGYDENGNLTSKNTSGFGGATSNSYTYDRANRLTSWDNGVSPVIYAYDKSGNRIQAGNRTFTYDQRNQLVNSSDGVSYQYSARGTLLSASGPGGTAVTRTDAYGQVVAQGRVGAGEQSYAYDGLGRLVRAGFAYSGRGNTLATDGTASYVRGADDALLGVSAGGEQRAVWTDLHDDVVGQFGPTGTALAGFTTYDPLGTVVASNGMLGSLGYQSEWTDRSTGRVNMWARWYNTDTGQFDTRDSADLSPVPTSITANRFVYADANPLTVTDPTGHWPNWGKVFKSAASAVSSGWNSVTSAASSAWNTATSYASRAWNYVTSAVSAGIDKVKKAAANAVNWGRQKVNQAYEAYNNGRKYVAERAEQARQAAIKLANNVKQAGKNMVAKANRAIAKAGKTIADAYKETEKWVKEHKAEIAGFVVGAAVGLGCGALIGWTGVGAVACGALAGAAGALVTGYMKGERGWDLVATTVTGALGGAVGGVGGIVGARVASGLASQIGSFAGSLGGRVLSGGVAGGVGDAATQLATTGRINGSQLALAVGIGAVAGGFSRCHSFDPATRVLMGDGTVRPIKDVNIGDKVAATDPKTGRKAAKPVTALHLNRDTDLTDVTLKTKDPRSGRTKTSTLKTTSNHPFWSKTVGAWVLAGALIVGHQFHTDTGQTATVAAVRNHTGAENMRDLTVADIHTYHVIAGTTPVLVHNCGNTPPGVSCSCFPATGAGPSVPPIRVQGPWTRGDIGRGAHGLRPNHLGDRIEIHHADQMPGSPIHELDQVVHRGPGSQLHPNVNNQGVTGAMRAEDTRLHWWYRSQEQGWGHYDPALWFDNWPD